MRAVSLLAPLLALSSLGCAAVFRDSQPAMRLESNPSGAHASIKDQPVGATPVEAPVKRGGLTVVRMSKQGYEDHVGVVRKKTNGAWLTLDIILCPITICIPLIVDAAAGAWNDVPPVYVANMDPSPGPAPLDPSRAGPAASATPPPPGPPPSAMSDSERKATARAAYLEGVALQEKGDCPGALAKLETAQKLFDAPTHLLRIAQCQQRLGKLLEAQESYETLVRANLGPQPSEAFKQAQETAKRELSLVRPRVPSVRVQLTPAPGSLSELVVLVNGKPMPLELLGIARPVNPGTYAISATARGMKSATQTVELREGEQRVVDVALSR